MALQVEPEFLILWRVQPPSMDTFISDFRLLGLRKVRGPRASGRKPWTRYYHGQDLVVEVVFSDVRDGGTLTGISAVFNWYREDGTIGETKTELVERFTPSERQAEVRKRREHRVKDVFDKAATRAEVSNVLSYYMNELAQFEKFGVSRIRQAMDNETDPAIVEALSKRYTADSPASIKETLLTAMGLK